MKKRKGIQWAPTLIKSCNGGNEDVQFNWLFGIGEQITVKRWSSYILCIFSTPVFADCIGQPSSPVIKIEVKSCQIDERYENVLNISGSAQQVLSVYWQKEDGVSGIEVVHELKNVSENTFWLSSAIGCQVTKKTEKLWLYHNICNDTAQNVPSRQLEELWPDIEEMVIHSYEEFKQKHPKEGH